jgi:hypothetical protein
MPGHAFSIEDALLTGRWAEQIPLPGYCVEITPEYEHAEEVIAVYIPVAVTPTFRVHRTSRSVLLTDCIGLTLSVPTLAEALLAMVPLSKVGRRKMLKGADPAWLPKLSACPGTKLGSSWQYAGRFAARTTAALISRRRGQFAASIVRGNAQSGAADNS